MKIVFTLVVFLSFPVTGLSGSDLETFNDISTLNYLYEGDEFSLLHPYSWRISSYKTPKSVYEAEHEQYLPRVAVWVMNRHENVSLESSLDTFLRDESHMPGKVFGKIRTEIVSLQNGTAAFYGQVEWVQHLGSGSEGESQLLSVYDGAKWIVVVVSDGRNGKDQALLKQILMSIVLK